MAEERFSFSKVDTYNQCPFKYLVKYINKNFPKGSSIALEYGTLIHSIEESICNSIKDNKPINYGKLKIDFLAKMHEIERKYPEDFYSLDKSGRNYQQKSFEYLEKYIYRLERFMKEHPTLEIIGAEVPINFRFDDQYLFRGSIDRLLRDKITGEYIIHDIKSYNVPLKDEPGDRDEHLVTPLQFVVYSLAVSKMYGCDVETIKCGYDIPLCDIIQPAGTKGFITRGSNKLRKLFKGIFDGEWAPKPSALCHWCDYCATNDNAQEEFKYLCPYFMKWTKERKDFSKENEWLGIGNHQMILEHYLARHGIVLEREGGENNEGH